MAYSFSTLQQKLDKALDHVQTDLNTLRTGRASVQLLDPVRVEVYGTQMAVSELANINIPDPSLIVISPWDKSILENLEKAIANSGLNLNPVVDGDIIRIAIPVLTGERRQEMVKLLKQKTEQGRVMLRNVRTEAKQDIEKQEGEDGISEDDIRLEIEEMEDMIKKASAKLEEIASKKEQELTTV